jgi:bacteriocin resistance YdeI/OmpD-like protein
MSSRVVAGGVVHTIPTDLRRVLIASPKALAVWEDLTPLARNEWICWVLWPKKAETRSQTSSECDPSCWKESGGRVVGLAARIERTRN